MPAKGSGDINTQRQAALLRRHQTSAQPETISTAYSNRSSSSISSAARFVFVCLENCRGFHRKSVRHCMVLFSRAGLPHTIGQEGIIDSPRPGHSFVRTRATSDDEDESKCNLGCSRCPGSLPSNAKVQSRQHPKRPDSFCFQHL